MHCAADEELLERQDLAAVAERVLREQPHLGKRVEDDRVGLDPLDLVQHALVVSPSSTSDGWNIVY